jgi:hypothetical protein
MNYKPSRRKLVAIEPFGKVTVDLCFRGERRRIIAGVTQSNPPFITGTGNKLGQR